MPRGIQLTDFDFFISYASADKEWAQWLAWELQSQGFSVFLDSWQIMPGDSIASRLSDAINVSKNFIALISSNYMQSHWPQSEMMSVVLQGPISGPRILPILIEDVPVPPLLQTIGALNIVGRSRKEASDLLRSALKRQPEDIGPVEFPTYPEPNAEKLAPPRAEPGRIFVSYSHKDAIWLERLMIFLKPLEREGSVDIWSDKRILAGERWRTEIEQALIAADIAILLVSSHFLASDFIHNEELPRILAHAAKGSTKVYSLIVRPSRYIRSSLAQFQSFNPPSEPLSKLNVNDREELLVRFADFIEDSFD
jgi:hypothetical protein